MKRNPSRLAVVVTEVSDCPECPYVRDGGDGYYSCMHWSLMTRGRGVQPYDGPPDWCPLQPLKESTDRLLDQEDR